MGPETLNFKQLQQQSNVSEMLFALENGLKTHQINFYLLGSIEQKNQSLDNKDIKNQKTCFSFFINDKSSYPEIREYLINKKGFTGDKNNLFSLNWKNNLVVFLIPFGEYQTRPSKVIIGLTCMDVLVLNQSLPPTITDTNNLALKKHFNFCSLPGIVLLKLISFEQCADKKLDIIKDISKIIKHFFDLYTCQIYKKHNNLLNSHDINLQCIAGRIIGRDMREETKLNEDIFLKIKKILQKNSIDIRSSEIAKMMVNVSENTIQENLKILKEIKIGYLED
jgi:predicted nucleotidyltransferase